MAETILNLRNEKQPFKVIEIPLNKFVEEVIPHHERVFEQHKISCQKLISTQNISELCRETKNKERIVKQLKDLMYELDTLRTHVEDTDLDKFDAKTLSLRKTILNLTTGYKRLKDTSAELMQAQQDLIEYSESNESSDPFSNVPQLQVHADIDDIKLQGDVERLSRVEAIEEDVKDLHEIYTQINEMVAEQRQDVDHIEESVESSNANVQAGLKQLIKAYKLKGSAYAVTGAFLGSIIGGPIGLVAGLKVGGIAALGCGLAGFTGGRMLKKMNDHEVESSETVQETQPEIEVPPENRCKKDI